ncbi:hypothetical protein T459_20755 [Capsicum annuum]|uniref:Uncharacterized protein n=1 Tax=Capsicum annuum TaxID=4072 RepID=A0A2G2Z5H0_CAPAN|nr:hypothetical protein T459_20755 [Capsicum annuum]
MAAKVPVGCEPVVGSLTPSKKKEYRVTNRLQEGKRPLYAVVFNFIDSRYFNVFATVGGNRMTRLFEVEGLLLLLLCFWDSCMSMKVKIFNSFVGPFADPAHSGSFLQPGFPWYGMVWYGYHGNHVCFHGFLKMVVWYVTINDNHGIKQFIEPPNW